MIENIDFYYDENGDCVFTKTYLLKRGVCCENACRHCPFGFQKRHDPHTPSEWNDPWTENNSDDNKTLYDYEKLITNTNQEEM